MESVWKRVAQEIHQLSLSPPEGIRLADRLDLDSTKLNEIYAVIDGPEDTPFAGGQFEIKLILGNEFPSLPPKATMLTQIFHPNVSRINGEICVNTLKKDWTCKSGIQDVLLTIKCLLMDPNPESALNEEAGRLLLENPGDYAKQARLMTQIHARKLTEELVVESALHMATSPSKMKKKTLRRL